MKHFYIFYIVLVTCIASYAQTEVSTSDDSIQASETTHAFNQDSNDIKMFPNPAMGREVTILSKQDIAVEVFDILGKKVAFQKITPTYKKLNISNLKPGLYLVKFKSANYTETRKLIVR